MMDLGSYVKRNGFNIALLTVVLLIIVGFCFFFIPLMAMDGYAQLVSASDLTMEETYRVDGALQWWIRANATLFLPLSLLSLIHI